MLSTCRLSAIALSVCALCFLAISKGGVASGTVGEHVNEMSAHIDEYTEEVQWLIGKVDGIVAAYEKGGKQAAGAEAVVDHWEAVEFHSAIETHYIPLYAKIWQGLFAVRLAIEEGKPVAEVRAEQAILEQVLWQSLGAVKVAAQYQERGLLAAVEATSADTPVETIDVIKQRLDRVLAKYAEQLPDEATEIALETYRNLFEGIEDALFAADADLAEDLELAFKVTLYKAIEEGKSVDEVRELIVAMQDQLDSLKAQLRQA